MEHKVFFVLLQVEIICKLRLKDYLKKILIHETGFSVEKFKNMFVISLFTSPTWRRGPRFLPL